MWPKLRHVVTCLNCGHRQATSLLNSYPERCPRCGSGLEHLAVPFDNRLDLADVPRDPRPIFHTP